jgi:repressor LexA
MQGLTDRQREILDFISRRIEEQGYPPTIREIGEVMGIRSTNGVNDHLKALERKGFLKREGLKSRALRPVSAPEEDVLEAPVPNNVVPFSGKVVAIPVLGRVAAGAPILADENVEATVHVDSFFLGTQAADRVFALRVSGESMIDAGIYDGDYIFVRKQLEARAGQIVVAMIDGEATVKRYQPEQDHRHRRRPGHGRHFATASPRPAPQVAAATSRTDGLAAWSPRPPGPPGQGPRASSTSPSEADVGAFVDWAHDAMGGLNGLINNAGILRDGLLVKKDRTTGAITKLTPTSGTRSSRQPHRRDLHGARRRRQDGRDRHGRRHRQHVVDRAPRQPRPVELLGGQGRAGRQHQDLGASSRRSASAWAPSPPA